MVAAARSLVAAGHLVDLTTLERNTADLCAAINGLSAEDGREVRPLLISLIDDLDKLADALKERQAELKGELEDLGARQRATAAYGRGTGQSK